jgi:uncharacterized Zn-binding protein involved in type VI secretion
MTVGSKTLAAISLAATATALAFAGPSYADSGKSSQRREQPTTTVSHAGGATVSVQGVVQSVSGSAVVVRQLDGSTVSVGINRNARITVDGRPGKISDVKPGYVLVTTVKAGEPTAALRFLRPS